MCVSVCLSVCLSVGLSRKCIVAKWLRLSGSGCHYGKLGRSSGGCIDGDGYTVEGEGAVLGVNLGRPIVNNEDFVANACGGA